MFKSYYLQSYLLFAGFSSLLFFVALQAYLLFTEKPAFSIGASIWLSAFVFLLLQLFGLYYGIRSTYALKGKYSLISSNLYALRNGTVPERLVSDKREETARVAEEVNALGDYLQEQAAVIQRMADEKSVLSEQAHTAAVMEERQRIARDLHDAVSQQLFALNMMSAAALKMFDQSPEYAKQQLSQIADISIRAQGEMRALLLHLRPIQLQKDSLCDGIIKLLKELKAKTNLHFKASIDEVEGLTKAAEEHLFRIVQEAVSNVIRHADAEEINVELSEEAGYARLYISDNGKGFNPEDAKMASYGIHTMKERCKEIGGNIKIRSKADEGTYIDIKVPVKGSVGHV